MDKMMDDDVRALVLELKAMADRLRAKGLDDDDLKDLLLVKDEKGIAAFITGCLAEADINIANMRMYREGRGKKAVTVIETDDFIPDEIKDKLITHEGITSVDIIEL